MALPIKRVKVKRLDPFTMNFRKIKIGDILKVRHYSEDLRRDNPDKRKLYLVYDKKGKPITLYNCEIEEL